MPCRRAGLCPLRDGGPFADHLGAMRNTTVGRHVKCGSYCQRLKNGEVKCRFDFPIQPHDVNDKDVPYFFCEPTKSGVRWRLYLPVNDGLMGRQNLWQAVAANANTDFSPLIDHHSAVEYATKYATKKEKGSGTMDSLLTEALRRMEAKGVDDSEGAIRVFSSYLVQQVGGRDWSAQEVSHANMGIHSTWGSHDFITKNLSKVRQLKNTIDGTAEDDACATEDNAFGLYLRRMVFAFNAGRHSAPDPNQLLLPGAPPPQAAINLADVEACNVADFYRRYMFDSAGRGKKGQRTIVPLVRPTVVVFKPHMPPSWGRTGHAKRAAYSRVQLQLYKPFKDEAEFKAYMQTHGGDYVKAYSEFAATDDAPKCCRDDIRPLEFDMEGIPIADERGEAHSGFAVFEANNHSDHMAEIKVGDVDWWSRNLKTYSDEQLADAERWQTRAKMAAQPAPSVEVDVTKLNEEQAFIYRVVQEHCKTPLLTRKPLRMLVCGTAGSGKTYLIRALKQVLGSRCVVCAPTGVAADNIGGRTYHSLIPIPRNDVNRDEVALDKGLRLNQMQTDLHGIDYLIIDEMSMVGRRSLSHIDQLLRQAKGRAHDRFGGMSLILVGFAQIQTHSVGHSAQPSALVHPCVHILRLATMGSCRLSRMLEHLIGLMLNTQMYVRRHTACIKKVHPYGEAVASKHTNLLEMCSFWIASCVWQPPIGISSSLKKSIFWHGIISSVSTQLNCKQILTLTVS